MRILARNGIAGLVFLLVSGSAMAQKARWVTTHSWSGVGSKQTEMFWLNAGKWRVRYKPRGSGIFQVCIYDEQGELLEIAADMRRPLAGYKTFRTRGKRYLAITGVDVKWTVTIEQRMSVIEEWQLTQVMRQQPPTLRKLGTWTGDKDAQYEFTVPHGSWKLVYNNSKDGFLQVLIRSDEGMAALAANTSSKGQDESWVHTSGKFTMEVKSAETNWEVDVFCEQ